jgi:hypothetical protein
VIGKQDVTGFAVDAFISHTTSFVFRALTGKGEVHGEALPRNGRGASRVMARCSLLELHGETDGALIKDGFFMRKLWNAVDVFVGVVQVCIAGVCKALVPEEAFGANVQFVEMELLEDRRTAGFMKGIQGVKVGIVSSRGRGVQRGSIRRSREIGTG